MKKAVVVTLLVLLCSFSSIAQKPRSDRDLEGLKGNVKELVVEEAKLEIKAGKPIEDKRRRDYRETYDELGNLTGRITYDLKGNVRHVAVYSVIDGDRVAKVSTMHYEYDPPPMKTKSPKSDLKVGDQRYTYKFKYKYDDKGNRTETSWYSNDGKLSSRYVSRYDEMGNEIEWIRYTGDGKIESRRTSKYDEKGNEIEKTYFDGNDLVKGKFSYTFEFDSKGNWIKRNSSRWVTKNGKSYFEPYEVTYRIIAYY
jgi:hypothetical protein